MFKRAKKVEEKDGRRVIVVTVGADKKQEVRIPYTLRNSILDVGDATWSVPDVGDFALKGKWYRGKPKP